MLNCVKKTNEGKYTLDLLKPFVYNATQQRVVFANCCGRRSIWRRMIGKREEYGMRSQGRKPIMPVGREY